MSFIELPGETWQQMLILLIGILVAWSVPLAIVTLIRRTKGKDSRSLWIRYGSWFIMVPAFVIPMLLGKYFMQAFLLLMSLYAFEEFSRSVGLWKERAHMWLGRLSIVLIFLPVFIQSFGTFLTMPAYVIIIAFLLPILRDRYRGMIQRTCLTILGVIYFGWFLAHLAFLMNIETGRQLILAFMLVVVTNDASAYIIGSNIGRHRMTPNVSPNKTWEGAIGAVIVTIAMTFAVRFALYNLSIKDTLILGFLLAAGGTCGDLAISIIKRDVQVKDTGSLIPGHGGLLDRLDSVLFTAPIFFHFMNAFYVHSTGISL